MSSRNIKRVLLSLILLSMISGTLLYLKLLSQRLDVSSSGSTGSNLHGSSYLPKLYLKPEQVKIRPKESAVVNVVLVNGSNVAVLDIAIEYDGRVIEVLNVTSNYSINYTTGYMHDHFLKDFLKLYISPERHLENDSIVASITIRGVHKGESILSFSTISMLYDERGELINGGFFGIAKVVVSGE